MLRVACCVLQFSSNWDRQLISSNVVEFISDDVQVRNFPLASAQHATSNAQPPAAAACAAKCAVSVPQTRPSKPRRSPYPPASRCVADRCGPWAAMQSVAAARSARLACRKQVERQCFNSPIPFVTKRDFCVLRGRATLQTADQDWVRAPL